jgi:hypothetical protein
MPTIGLIPMNSVAVASDYQWYSWNVIEAINFAKISNDLTAVTTALVEWTPHTSSYSAQFYSKEESVYLTDYSPKLTIS